MATPTTDRRKNDPMAAAASDRITKQMIVFAVCGISVLFTVTECLQAIYSGHVEPEINQMSTLVVGALIGWLGKTGVDYIGTQHQEPPTAQAIGDAVGPSIVAASKVEPVQTEAVDDGAKSATQPDTGGAG